MQRAGPVTTIHFALFAKAAKEMLPECSAEEKGATSDYLIIPAATNQVKSDT
jgi:hypothetical protein